MFGQLEIFQLAQDRAVHAGARQAKIAANIANADTPGYRATDLAPFMRAYRETHGGATAMRATRATHDIRNTAPPGTLRHQLIDRPSGTSPNGNTVSLEMELLEGIEADRAHNRAVTVYQTALNIVRTSLRGGR